MPPNTEDDAALDPVDNVWFGLKGNENYVRHDSLCAHEPRKVCRWVKCLAKVAFAKLSLIKRMFRC